MYQFNKKGEKLLDSLIAVMKKHPDSIGNLGLMTAATMLSNFLLNVTSCNDRDRVNDIEVTDAMIKTLRDIITHLEGTRVEIIEKMKEQGFNGVPNNV